MGAAGFPGDSMSLGTHDACILVRPVDDPSLRAGGRLRGCPNLESRRGAIRTFFPSSDLSLEVLVEFLAPMLCSNWILAATHHVLDKVSQIDGR